MTNYLQVFSNPSKVVRAVLENPNLPFAVVFVLLPTILSILVSLVFGFGFNFTAVTRSIGDIVLWLVSGIVLYIILYVAKGKEVKGHFQGLITGLSLTSLVTVLMFVVFFASIMIIAPGLIEVAKSVNANMTPEELGEKFAVVLEGVDLDNLLTFGVLSISSLLILFLILLNIYIVIQLIDSIEHSSRLKNLVILGIYLIAAYSLKSLIVF